MLRVIAGTARGRRLVVPPVRGLRPTSDRARETLFNVLGGSVRGARFLDLFAGSGAVGIEALSRGAARAVFIERDGRARRGIEANVETCGLGDSAEVVGGDWRTALRRLGRERDRGDREPFDIAFLDPPYAWEGAADCLELLDDLGLVAADGLAVVEHHRHRPPEARGPEGDDGARDEDGRKAGSRGPRGWRRRRVVEVGDTHFTLYDKV